jgi:hypothetical protein
VEFSGSQALGCRIHQTVGMVRPAHRCASLESVAVSRAESRNCSESESGIGAETRCVGDSSGGRSEFYDGGRPSVESAELECWLVSGKKPPYERSCSNDINFLQPQFSRVAGGSHWIVLALGGPGRSTVIQGCAQTSGRTAAIRLRLIFPLAKEAHWGHRHLLRLVISLQSPPLV